MTTTTTLRTRRPVAAGGRACVAASVLGVVGGLYIGFVPADVPHDRYSYPFTASGFVALQLVLVVHHLLQLGGLLGLHRAQPATGRSWHTGMRLAIAGIVLFTVCELWGVAFADAAADGPGVAYIATAYGVASIAIGAGLTLAGVAVARAGRWTGWRRWTPLACGAAVFVVVLPGVAAGFLAGRLALAAWMLAWAALGIALLTDARRA